MARGNSRANSEVVAAEMRAAGMTIQQPRQQSVVDYLKDNPNRSLKGLYKPGSNIEILDANGNFTPARVLEVKDRSVVLFPIFKIEGVAGAGAIRFTLERNKDGKPVGIRTNKYNLRAGL